MYRLWLESLRGLRLEGDTLRLSPCIHADWPDYRVRYRFRDTVYRIHVRQEAGRGAPPRLLVDGAEQPGLAIPLAADHAQPVVERWLPKAGRIQPPSGETPHRTRASKRQSVR